jgi:hypothetical protein
VLLLVLLLLVVVVVVVVVLLVVVVPVFVLLLLQHLLLLLFLFPFFSPLFSLVLPLFSVSFFQGHSAPLPFAPFHFEYYPLSRSLSL